MIDNSESNFLERNQSNLIESNIKNKNQKIPFVYHKFILSLSEVNFGKSKIGHIFKFELFTGNNNIDSSATTTKNHKKNL